MRASSNLSPAEVSDAEAREFLLHARALVGEWLGQLVPAEDVEPRELHAAIRWSLLAGGKRLRPALVLACGAACGACAEALVRTACAFEMLHTYSLVHDDLPSMDNDELRRGRPTCHVRFDEATAILAGDALQSLAFQTVAEDEGLGAETRVAVIRELSRAAGTPAGMVAGQIYDLAGEARRGGVTGVELDLIHRHKTGALITAAARAGAIIADANETDLAAITRYAAALGLLFQITDDLLDVTATAADLGKTPGKDARTSKATYPALYGIEAAREHARAVYDEALGALDQFGQPATLLRSIASLILERRA